MKVLQATFLYLQFVFVFFCQMATNIKLTKYAAFTHLVKGCVFPGQLKPSLLMLNKGKNKIQWFYFYFI